MILDLNHHQVASFQIHNRLRLFGPLSICVNHIRFYAIVLIKDLMSKYD